ncbi:MAG: DUF362 domain-containing protein [Candidatus Margulisiibacteriota bacterium]
MAKVFIDEIAGQLPAKLRAAAVWTGLDKGLAGRLVFLKPNLTYPKFKPGVTTTPALLETLIVLLKEYGCRIIVGESDGGYNSYAVKDAFHDYGLYDYEKKYGIRVVNLSQLPFGFLTINKFGREFKVEIPRLLTDEIEGFITLPVPKVHAMTQISLSYKNQWGCVPNVMRLRYHPVFNEAIFAINRAIKNKYTIIDGTYGLTRSGPMVGDAFDLGWVLASDSFEAADLVASRLMKVDLRQIRHYYLAYKNKLVPRLEEIELNQAIGRFVSDRFYLKRDIWSYLALSAWLHPVINYTFYESPVSDLLHKIMYTFRQKPISE